MRCGSSQKRVRGFRDRSEPDLLPAAVRLAALAAFLGMMEIAVDVVHPKTRLGNRTRCCCSIRFTTCPGGWETARVGESVLRYSTLAHITRTTRLRSVFSCGKDSLIPSLYGGANFKYQPAEGGECQVSCDVCWQPLTVFFQQSRLSKESNTGR